MKIPNVNNINIKPSDRKMKRAKQTAENLGSRLPKEMPLERKMHFVSAAETMERIKDKIQITIENMQNKV